MKTAVVSRLIAVLWAASAALVAPAAVAAEVPISEEAKAHFAAGVNLMQDPDGPRYEEAYREFKAAYEASASWKILGNLGIAAMKLERDGEAIQAFEQYLAKGGSELDAAERKQFETDLNTLKTAVAHIEITGLPEGAVLVDERVPVQGRAVINRYHSAGAPLKLGIRSGYHRMVAKLPGHNDGVWEFEATSGTNHSHQFELTEIGSAAAPAAAPLPVAENTTPAPAVAMERPVPASVYVGLAATGAVAIGATVTGVLALGKGKDFEEANDGSDPTTADDLHSSTKTLNLVTDVFVGAAVVGAAITTILYVQRPEVPVRQGPATARLRLQPVVSPKGAALAINGTF